MPVFFFDLHLGQRQFLDEEGTELPSAMAARDEALATVRDLLKPSQSTVPGRWLGWSLRVRDDLGTSLLRLPIGPSSAGSAPDATPPMLVSSHPADHDLRSPLAEQQEATLGKPSAGAFGSVGRQRAAEHDRSVVLVERCRRLLKALSREVFAAKQEIGRSRQIVMRARSAGGPTSEDYGLLPAVPAHRSQPFLMLVPGSR
jgi:hypothetical protein